MQDVGELVPLFLHQSLVLWPILWPITLARCLNVPSLVFIKNGLAAATAGAAVLPGISLNTLQLQSWRQHIKHAVFFWNILLTVYSFWKLSLLYRGHPCFIWHIDDIFIQQMPTYKCGSEPCVHPMINTFSVYILVSPLPPPHLTNSHHLCTTRLHLPLKIKYRFNKCYTIAIRPDASHYFC